MACENSNSRRNISSSSSGGGNITITRPHSRAQNPSVLCVTLALNEQKRIPAHQPFIFQSIEMSNKNAS